MLFKQGAAGCLIIISCALALPRLSWINEEDKEGNVVIPILIKNHSLMHAEMRRGKDARCSSPHASSDAQNLTQGCAQFVCPSFLGCREAETQSREEGRGDPSGEALRSIAFYKQTGDKRGAGKRARCSAVKTNTNSEKSNLFCSINEKWKGSHFRDGSLTRLFQYRRYTGLQGF